MHTIKADSNYGPFALSAQIEADDAQARKFMQEGLTSAIFRGGNSKLDKAFKPKGPDGKVLKPKEGEEKWSRDNVVFTPSGVEVVVKELTSFLATLGGNPQVVVTLKVQGEKEDTYKLFLPKAKAVMSANNRDAVIEFLEEHNPGVTCEWVNGIPDEKSLALLIKANHNRLMNADLMAGTAQ